MQQGKQYIGIHNQFIYLCVGFNSKQRPLLEIIKGVHSISSGLIIVAQNVGDFKEYKEYKEPVKRTTTLYMQKWKDGTITLSEYRNENFTELLAKREVTITEGDGMKDS